jgi:hypothetical protein
MTVIGSSELPPSGSSPSLPQLMAPRHGFKRFGEISRSMLTHANVFGAETENYGRPVPNFQEDAYHEWQFLTQSHV